VYVKNYFLKEADLTNKMSGNGKSGYLTRKKEGLAIWDVEKKPEETKQEIDFSELDKEFENE
jgi:hypothetical protein